MSDARPSPGSGQRAPGHLDWRAIRSGASVALVFAVPLSIAARAVADSADEGGSGLAVLLSFGAVIGFLLGAGVAAWHQQRGTPLSHGIVTAGGTYLVAQSVFVAVKLLRGDEVAWSGVLFNLTVTLMAGILGGFLGSFLQQQGVSPRSGRAIDREGGRP
jgi:hypothetical protein